MAYIESFRERVPNGELPTAQVEFRLATPEDTRSILDNIGQCHHLEELDEAFQSQTTPVIPRPTLKEYKRMFDEVFADPEKKDKVLVAETPEHEVVSALTMRLRPEKSINQYVADVRWFGEGEPSENVVRAWEAVYHKQAAWFTAFYTRPDNMGRNIGKGEWALGLDIMEASNPGLDGVIYYTNRRAGKQFTRKYFPDFILDKTQRSRGSTLVVYLPFNHPKVQAFRERFRPS